ncbi:MRPS7 [Cordylochernes scorpioides]|uniref:MRPS7 n=1 Tax=Cordylochernes scorpioides TaxID=51811 RepID=A0ABY6KGU8_9ARAC|nr:MRPS7 [Cordylochernes scorpioides]
MLSLFSKSIRINSGLKCLIAQYSVYPPSYIEPLIKKEALLDLEKIGAKKEYKYVPVKAAYGDHTNSLFDDPVLNKFICVITEEGRKEKARSLMTQTLELVKITQLKKYYSASNEEKKNIECDPLKIFVAAVENCKPILDIRPLQRGGVTYQVPVPISQYRQRHLAMKWLMLTAIERDKKNIRFHEQMAKELLDAYYNTGRVIRKKQELHKQCEANKSYAHYRWG